MTLLQPSDVPSRSGINNAITSEIDLAVRTTDPADQFYDSGWLALPGTPSTDFTFTVRQYRIKNGMVQIRFQGTLISPIAVSGDGNITDRKIGDLPAGARPGGGGISSSTVVPVEIGGIIFHALIYNGGAFNLAYADRTGSGYNFNSPSTNPSFVGISPLLTINS